MAKPDAKVVDDDTKTTEEDLRKLKYGEDEVETSQEADETSETEETEEDSEEVSEEEGKTDDSQDEETEEESDDDSDEESSEFVKEFPNIKGDTIEEYTRELEKTQRLSQQEGKRLSDELKKVQSAGTTTEETQEVDTSDPVKLYMNQKMQEEIDTAFSEFKQHYPQADADTNPVEYEKFTREVAILSRTILESEGRLANPRDLYKRAAVILDWEPVDKVDNKDKLNIALKGQAAVSKTTSSAKTPKKSKVTDQMVALNRVMYPDKTDAEIRTELEPYVK